MVGPRLKQLFLLQLFYCGGAATRETLRSRSAKSWQFFFAACLASFVCQYPAKQFILQIWHSVRIRRFGILLNPTFTTLNFSFGSYENEIVRFLT